MAQIDISTGGGLSTFETQLLNSNAFTGLREGGDIQLAQGDNTRFDISDGEGQVVDNYTDLLNPVVTTVSWSGLSNIEVPLIANAVVDVAINISGLPVVNGHVTITASDLPGAVEQRVAGGFSQEDLRDFISIGRLVGTGTFFFIANPFHRTLGLWRDKMQDFLFATTPSNIKGNKFSQGTTLLTLDKTAGQTIRDEVKKGGNLTPPDFKSPSILNDPALAAASLNYISPASPVFITRATVDVAQRYDKVTDALVAVPSNRYSVQRIYFFTQSNFVAILYGQEEHANFDDAVAAIETEEIIFPAALDKGVHLASLAIKGNTLDLDLSENLIKNFDEKRFATNF